MKVVIYYVFTNLIFIIFFRWFSSFQALVLPSDPRTESGVSIHNISYLKMFRQRYYFQPDRLNFLNMFPLAYQQLVTKLRA